MAIKASEISELIKAKIENFDHEAQASDIGTVVSVTAINKMNIKKPPVYVP